MRKVLFVHDGPIYYDDRKNYYEMAYHGLLERYRYLGDEITFLMRVVPLTEETKNTKVPSEIRVIGVDNFKDPRVYLSKISGVIKIIEKAVDETDMLVLRGGSCSDIALRFAKQKKKPYIYECVGCVWDSLWNYSLLGKVMAPWVFIATRKRIKAAPFVYYVTNEFLQRRYPTNGITVSCSNVVITQVSESVLVDRLERIKKYNSETVYKIGTAAAIDVRYKGQEYVISAISELRKRGIKIEYYLAGGNRLSSTYLRDMAGKLGMDHYVHFVGSLDSSQMSKFYDMLDIYVQPSKQEGLPRAIIEAMSRGLPIIGTNVAGIPELLQEENLFKKGSSKAVANSLERMICSDMLKYARQNFEKAKN